MSTAAYTRARTVSRATGKTPYELYEGRKPDLSHLREIGCRAFVLQLNNPKVGMRGDEFVLIGYAPNLKAYWCYHRKTRKVVESFHVDFVERKDEEECPLLPGRIVGTMVPLCGSCQKELGSDPDPCPMREPKKVDLETTECNPHPTREQEKVD